MYAQIHRLVSSLDSLPQEWRVVPAFGKRPLGQAWQNQTYSPKELQAELTRCRLKVWINNRYVIPNGVALVCGPNHPQGYLAAIDCDGATSWRQILKINEDLQPEEFEQISPADIRERALRYLPPTIAFTSGKEYRSQHLYLISNSIGEVKSRKIQTGKNEHLEFRGKNLASILPPSYHPEGRTYKWLHACSPEVQQLASAPAWVIAQMLDKQERRLNLPQKKYVRRYEINNYTYLHPRTRDSIQTALVLLEVIHPRFADDYDSWIQVGMALKDVSPSLLNAWDSWSRLSPKYKPGECSYKWKSFRGAGITIRTLFEFANLS